VWKFGCRWSDYGKKGTSIFERAFLPYGVVFTYKDCSSVCEGDLIAIADGYQVIAIARAETPGLRMHGLDKERYGELCSEYFADMNVFGCRAQIKILDETDTFEYKKMGMFYCAGKDVTEKVNKLAKHYFEPISDHIDLPCLFDWANKELAQDSFLCWLLECANSSRQERSLCIERRIGFEFMKRILERSQAPIPSDNDTVTVRVHKQIMSIDVAAAIEFAGIRIGLLIEDKVDAAVYNDIDSYCERLKSIGDFSGLRIYPVVVRTGDESNVVDGKVPYYLREDFLNLFNQFRAEVEKSQLLSDFYRHISAVESEIKSYETLSLKNWHWSSWKGFYAALQRSGKVVQDRWSAVCGNGRGFLCAFPSWDGANAYIDGGMVIYWQFESDLRRLALKIMEVGENKKRVRDFLIEKIDCYLDDHPEWNDLCIQNVDKRGIGYSMTIKVIPPEGWYVEVDGKIAMDSVIDRIAKINRFRDVFVKDLFIDARYDGGHLIELLKS